MESREEGPQRPLEGWHKQGMMPEPGLSCMPHSQGQGRTWGEVSMDPQAALHVLLSQELCGSARAGGWSGLECWRLVFLQGTLGSSGAGLS